MRWRELLTVGLAALRSFAGSIEDKTNCCTIQKRGNHLMYKEFKKEQTKSSESGRFCSTHIHNHRLGYAILLKEIKAFSHRMKHRIEINGNSISVLFDSNRRANRKKKKVIDGICGLLQIRDCRYDTEPKDGCVKFNIIMMRGKHMKFDTAGDLIEPYCVSDNMKECSSSSQNHSTNPAKDQIQLPESLKDAVNPMSLGNWGAITSPFPNWLTGEKNKN